VNRRRAARSVTSGSGGPAGETTCRGTGPPLTARVLGASGTTSLPAGAGRRGGVAFFGLAMAEPPLSALYSNSRGGQCLTIVGTEGVTCSPADQWRRPPLPRRRQETKRPSPR